MILEIFASNPDEQGFYELHVFKTEFGLLYAVQTPSIPIIELHGCVEAALGEFVDTLVRQHDEIEPVQNLFDDLFWYSENAKHFAHKYLKELLEAKGGK